MKSISIDGFALPLIALIGASGLWLSLQQRQRRSMHLRRKHASVTKSGKKETNSQSHPLVAQRTIPPQSASGLWQISYYNIEPENVDNQPNAQAGVVETSQSGPPPGSNTQSFSGLQGFSLVRGALSWTLDGDQIRVDVYYTDDEHLRDEVTYFRVIEDAFSETWVLDMYLTDNGKNNPWGGINVVSYFTITPLP